MREVRLPCFNMILKLEGNSGVIHSDLSLDPENHKGHFWTFIVAVESLVLAHACAGVDIGTPAYVEGIETAIEHAMNEYGE